jgi:putative Ca2+/H+ antiporter (TMEM165/GDT1 family)
MLMRKLFSPYASRGLNALAATMLLAAGVHLGVALVSFIFTRQINYVNPVDFLGFSIVWPSHLRSEATAAIAWLLLVTTFFVIFIFHNKLQISVSVTRKTKLPALSGEEEEE